MGNAMRITKAFLRNATLRMTFKVNEVFKLTDEQLKNFVQSGMPGIVIEESKREELLRMAVHWIIDEAIPPYMVNS